MPLVGHIPKETWMIPRDHRWWGALYFPLIKIMKEKIKKNLNIILILICTVLFMGITISPVQAILIRLPGGNADAPLMLNPLQHLQQSQTSEQTTTPTKETTSSTNNEALQQQIITQNNTIANLNSRTANLNYAITSLKTQNTTLQQQRAELGSQITALKDQLIKIQKQITELQNQIETQGPTFQQSLQSDSPPIPESGPLASQEPELSSTTQDRAKSEVTDSIKCNIGYALSFDKKHCIKIPENAHAANSPTDLWFCNDGYKEINNTCILISNQEEKPKEEPDKSPVVDEPQESKSFVANVWKITSGFFVKIFKRLF